MPEGTQSDLSIFAFPALQSLKKNRFSFGLVMVAVIIGVGVQVTNIATHDSQLTNQADRTIVMQYGSVISDQN